MIEHTMNSSIKNTAWVVFGTCAVSLMLNSLAGFIMNMACECLNEEQQCKKQWCEPIRSPLHNLICFGWLLYIMYFLVTGRTFQFL